MFRRRVGSLSDNRPPSSFHPTSPASPTSTYTHASTHRSLKTLVTVFSPSVRVVGSTMIPAFGNGDKVEGKVTLDSSCASTGRLSISIEGAFSYDEQDKVSTSNFRYSADKRKHVFYSSSRTVSVSPSSESLATMRSSKFKGTFGRALRKRPSASSLQGAPQHGRERVYPFQFELPRSCRAGEELPPTFVSSCEDKPKSFSSPSMTSSSGLFQVEYKLQIAWEATDASEYPALLDVPIFFHSDADFQSVDLTPKENTSWLEMPLRSDRPMPFRCAITLPTSVTFSRASSIPYYVVFTTTPRSPTLTREIASDASISVTLVRKITVTQPSTPPPTPPQTPSTEDSDSSRGSKFLKRVARSRAGSITSWSPMVKTPVEEISEDGPFRLPMQTVFTNSRPLHTSICLGFPKRPRGNAGPESKHPSLDTQASLPDGLHKAKFSLSRNMLPSIDWSGVSVKYYLDVSVSVGQEDLRARVPIRLV